MPMLVVLAIAVISLLFALWFAVAADAKRLAILRALTWTQVFAIVSGVASNLVAVCWYVGKLPDNQPVDVKTVFIGIGEALTPAIAGGTALTLTWLLISLGMRRVSPSALES